MLKETHGVISAVCLALTAFTGESLGQNTDHVPDQSYTNLYAQFTGRHDFTLPKSQWTIAMHMAGQVAKDPAVTNGHLLVLTSDALNIYQADSTHVATIDTRTADWTGFTEITSTSHIGPSLAYLGYLADEGVPEWRAAATNLLQAISGVAAFNRDNPDWLTELNNPAWNPHIPQIKNMIVYACEGSTNFLNKALSGEIAMSSASVNEMVFTTNRPYGFNQVMVATFHLEGLSEFYRLAKNLGVVSGEPVLSPEEWQNARVIVRMPVGNNFSGGLWEGSNWTLDALSLLSGTRGNGQPNLGPNRVLLAAYSEKRDLTLENGKLNAADWNYYTRTVFGALYGQTMASTKAFSSITDLQRISRPPMVGDWGQASGVNDFMRRLKYSFGVKTELLSNTVGFWITHALANAGYDPAKVSVPGLELFND